MPTGACHYCQGELSKVRADRARGPIHTQAECREKLDLRISELLREGLGGVEDIAYRLDEEGVYDELSYNVIQTSIDRVKGQCG